MGPENAYLLLLVLNFSRGPVFMVYMVNRQAVKIEQEKKPCSYMHAYYGMIMHVCMQNVLEDLCVKLDPVKIVPAVRL